VEGEPPLLFDLDGRGNDIFPTGEFLKEKTKFDSLFTVDLVTYN
jgi:hypothetical protein